MVLNYGHAAARRPTVGDTGRRVWDAALVISRPLDVGLRRGLCYGGKPAVAVGPDR